MDELELVATLSADLAPLPSVVDRHRRRLQEAVRTELSVSVRRDQTAQPKELPGAAGAIALLGTDKPRRARPRPASALAAAAAVILLGTTVLVRLSGGSDHQRVTASEPSVTEGAYPATNGRGPSLCDSEFPVKVDVPAGYDGPRRGPGGDVEPSPDADQFVIHWQGPSGSVEARWPANHDRRASIASGDDGPGYRGVSFSEVAKPTANGREAKELFVLLDGASSACQTVQVTVADADRAQLDDTIDRVFFHLFDRRQSALITASSRADRAPQVTRCAAPTGQRAPINRGGTVTATKPQPTPLKGLESFLNGPDIPTSTVRAPSGRDVSQPTIATRGYVQIALQGEMAYAYRPNPNRDAVTTLIRVAETSRGWVVTSWEASGC